MARPPPTRLRPGRCALTAAAVFVAGDVDFDVRLDDEIEIFHVYVGDDDAEPIGKTYTVVHGGRNAAVALADRIAADRGLEVVID
jgi:hypothetical protein